MKPTICITILAAALLLVGAGFLWSRRTRV